MKDCTCDPKLLSNILVTCKKTDKVFIVDLNCESCGGVAIHREFEIGEDGNLV